jgi:hypothetical protein
VGRRRRRGGGRESWSGTLESVRRVEEAGRTDLAVKKGGRSKVPLLRYIQQSVPYSVAAVLWLLEMTHTKTFEAFDWPIHFYHVRRTVTYSPNPESSKP